jgi:hypothetical protein
LNRSIIEGAGLDFNRGKPLDFDYKKVDDALDYLEKLIKRNKSLHHLSENYRFIEESPDDIRDTLMSIFLSFKVFYLQFKDVLKVISDKLKIIFERYEKDEQYKKQKSKKRSRKKVRKYKEILPN